ncbi:MAG TPA: LamG domain-containing protein [Kofleriaceae bacterium]|nr:LamG domain-containing protein [Kofleriaceae bacterium]
MRGVVLLALAACGRIGFDAGTPTHSQLSLDRAVPGEPVTDFPLLVILDDTRANRTVMEPDASDLRFSAADGTPLAFEIERVGAAGGAPLVAWVRIPYVADATATITASYGVPGLARAPGTAWSDAYEAVWHMTGSGPLVDSTTHHRDGVATGTTEVAGQIATARAFDGAKEEWIGVADGASIQPPELTMSGWIDMASDEASGYYGMVTRELDDGGGDELYLGTMSQLAYGGAGANGVPDAITGPMLQLRQWTHVVFTYDGARMLSYAGTTPGAPLVASGPIADSGDPVYIGADRNNSGGTTPVGVPDIDFVNGAVDEIRIENVARDAAWIAYDLASQEDAIISYGPFTR